MNTDIIDKFTTHLKNVLTRALALTIDQGEEQIMPLHLLWALATQKGSIGSEILHKVGVTAEAAGALFANPTARLPLEASGGRDGKRGKTTNQKIEKVAPKLSSAAKRAIEKSVLTANLYEHKYVGTEHLLSGLLQIEDAAVMRVLAEVNVEIKILRQQITLVLKSTSKFPDLAASLGIAHDHELQEIGGVAGARERRRGGKKQNPKTPALDFFSADLTNPEAQTSIDPVIGREEEIERIMQILCRRTKNNPLLLGDPGVGKTALVEGLAKRITEGAVPEALQGKRILAIDLSLIVAGTMYRGEFEGRLKQIIDEVKANPEIILFIDEVHTIIGAGSASGSLDAANILKPALSRGEIHCLGATTLAEYKKHIETDAALERRFAPVMVSEPSKEKTLAILEGIKKNYEDFHRVIIGKDALAAAVNLSDRYIEDKFFPDKAIDLIDEAASSVRVQKKASTRAKKLRQLDEELARLAEEKRGAVLAERFIEAISLKEQERELEEARKKLLKNSARGAPGRSGRISAAHIAAVISRMTGIPTEDLVDEEKERLRNLENLLSRRVRGQNEVIASVAEYIRRAKTGIIHPRRPLASFLFVGPSGVGKTELAKTIAETVFREDAALVRLDMSEFSEGFTISKLIGAPAGYVGYRENAKLTDAVKRRPHSVVLFDELEKAHPDILNLLLQILDEGHLTDATGRKINFKNTIVVMTSNIGSERLGRAAIGFKSDEAADESTQDILAELQEKFRPEFLNRIDRICSFRQLLPAHLEEIADLQIAELNERLAPKHWRAVLDPLARSWLIKQKKVREGGARAIRRAIQDYVEGQIASLLLGKAPANPREVKITVKKDKLIIVEDRI